jgi:hypothetical protein
VKVVAFRHRSSSDGAIFICVELSIGVNSIKNLLVELILASKTNRWQRAKGWVLSIKVNTYSQKDLEG